jgi:hypothetical protein
VANGSQWLLAQCFGALVVSLSIPAGPAAGYDWLQFGGDAQHSGSNLSELRLGRDTVNSLAQKYQVMLPATVDGTPAFLEGVETSSGVKDLLFMTTTAGHILAVDAQTGTVVWSHQPAPVPSPCKINTTGGACYTTSSPAIDPNRQFVYSYGLDGRVHKYQVGDGTEITISGWPQLTTFKGFDEKGSGALALAISSGTPYLYMVHGGYPGDRGDYQGHVTAINLATGTQNVFNAACSDQAVHFQSTTTGLSPTCSTRQNAMWARPGAIYDAVTDRIFIGTGNAFAVTPPDQGQFDGNHNWSESVLALHPDGTGGAGKPLDSYTPTNVLSLDASDGDVGSTAPAILPVPPTSTVQHLAVQSGKDSNLRLINLADLSGQGGPGHTGGEVAVISNVPQGGAVLSQPAVWVNPADGSTWVFVVNGAGASALKLNIDDSGNPSLVAQWQDTSQGGTSPVVANRMVFHIGTSTVRALDAVSGDVLWSTARTGGTHWESLIVANGGVYATDGSSHLTAYAMLRPSSGVAMGRSDFNADGNSDIVWVNGTNGRWLSFMNGATVQATSPLPASAAGWVLAGIGDFNGDGHADLLWRNTTDATKYWIYLMNGTTIIGSGPVSVAPGYTPVQIGDFDGDGKADILWENAAGARWIYFMNGTSVITAQPGPAAAAGWVIAGVGDFNGDGKTDILWNNTASPTQYWIYLMDGANVIDGGGLTVGAGYSATQIADFDGDGKADILWENGTASRWIYFMNGASVASGQPAPLAAPGWTVAGVGDFNGDGRADLLWQNSANPTQYWVYLLNGTSVIGGGSLVVAPGYSPIVR